MVTLDNTYDAYFWKFELVFLRYLITAAFFSPLSKCIRGCVVRSGLFRNTHVS